MNKIILFLVLSILASKNLQAQHQENRLMAEEYIRQSEKQRKTGLIMVGVGAAAVGLGTALISSSNDLGGFDVGSGIVLFSSGFASTLIGIPVLISSGVKARRAAELSLQATRIQNPSILGQQTKVFPSIGISIPLNLQKR